VDGTFTVNPTNETNRGAAGVELCNTSDGHAVALGAGYDGPGSHTLTVGYGIGTLVGDPTGDQDPRTGHYSLATGFTSLGTVRTGSAIQVQIKEVPGGIGSAPRTTPGCHELQRLRAGCTRL
jgi:hypothetical protein